METLFFENDLRDYLDYVLRVAEKRVRDVPNDQFRAADPSDLVEHVLAETAPHVPLLRRSDVYAREPEEVEVRVMDYGQEIRRFGTRLTIAVPFEGERELFDRRPSSYTSMFPRAIVGSDELQLIYDLQPGAASPRDQIDRDLDLIEQYLGRVRTDVEAFLPQLRGSIRAAVDERRARLSSAAAAVTALGVPVKPRDTPKTPGPEPAVPTTSAYDAFLSYAGEDGDFAQALADALAKLGFKVWFAPLELTVGDSLNREISRGLREARFGIVILSLPFFSKPWPQFELGGLLAREMQGQKVVLPVWRNITKEQVLAHQPALADKFALASPPMDPPAIATALGKVLKRS